jgi:hypothetical protein
MRSLLRRPFGFWLPAFGLAFLLWAWADSCYHTSRMEVWGPRTRDGGWGLTLVHNNAALSVIYQRVSGVTRGSGPSPAGFGTGRFELGPDSSAWWFPLPLLGSSVTKDPQTSYRWVMRQLVLPHWLLIAGAVGLWWIGLRWSAKRRERSVMKDER